MSPDIPSGPISCKRMPNGGGWTAVESFWRTTDYGSVTHEAFDHNGQVPKP